MQHTNFKIIVQIIPFEIEIEIGTRIGLEPLGLGLEPLGLGLEPQLQKSHRSYLHLLYRHHPCHS